MKVTITNISGFASMFEAMYISKRSWTEELAKHIREVCYKIENDIMPSIEDKQEFDTWLGMSLKMGRRHITILRYLDISIMTEGIHRAGEDDIDSHSMRFNNRIIRSSTRLATFKQDEFSDYYKDKVITTDKMLENLVINIPEVVYEMSDGYFYDEETYELLSRNEWKEMQRETGQCPELKNTWIKSSNGYIKEEYKGNKDVMRGLYMLGIPSNFVSKINLCEWGHVFKERNENGGANPEVKQWAEEVMKQINIKYPLITRDYILSIEN